MKQGSAFRLQGFVIALVAVLGLGTRAQEIRLGDAQPAHHAHVELLSQTAEVKAGGPQTVELRFRVEDGFHINSHTPKDELLIPTEIRFNTGSVVKVVDQAYPKGSMFRLPVAGGETVDVYQGEFRVGLKVVVPHGASTLVGVLKYQACDNAVCYPPRTLPVVVAVTGN